MNEHRRTEEVATELQRTPRTEYTPLTHGTSLVYCRRMVFIESPAFTADVRELLSDYVVAQAQIPMILIYRKGTKDDLTPREKSVLLKMNAEW